MISLRAYLDSSGKREQKGGYLTLAAVAANDEMWSEFEAAWARILDQHAPKAKYVHMREILRLIDEFDPSQGWDLNSAFSLAMDCLGYMSHLDKKRFRMFYCSVDLKTWGKLRAATYQMPDPIDMCNKFCAESVLAWYLNYYPDLIDPNNDTVRYFFDQGEYFEKPFKEKWNAERNLAEETGKGSVWQIIDEVASVEMETTPGIQAADIIAWGINRELCAKEGGTAKYLGHIIRNVIPSYSIVWNEAKMKEHFKPLLYLP